MNESARPAVDVEALAARVGELERVALVGDADRVVGLAEVAPAINRAKATLRRWLRSPRERARRRLDLLFRRDASGRWVSTPRAIAAWRRATEVALTPSPLLARKVAAARGAR
ncbi:MAG TPA: hypothetical protein VGM13_08725 [Thermoanaerobaculia bacterium]|jgi:hypothetical protein